MPAQPGSHIAGYKVLSLLGSGGMGEVYLVESEQLQRREAMKVISVAGASNPDFQQRFTNEARTAASLDHPSIITIHNHGIAEDSPWYTMSYLEGPDLASTRLTPAEVGTVLTQVGDALDYAHQHQVVHRDIKPANIVVTRGKDGEIRRAVVLDFGIAKLANSPQLTAMNSIVGTMTYTAPEVISGAQAGPAADQYSLACTVYQLLAGDPPFSADSATALMMAHVQRPVPHVAASRPELGAVDAVLQRGMAKSPAERFPDCRTFAAEFVRALESTGPGAQTAVAPTPQYGAPSGQAAFSPMPASGPHFSSGPHHPSGPTYAAGPQYGAGPQQFQSGHQQFSSGPQQFPSGPQSAGFTQQGQFPGSQQPYGAYAGGPPAAPKSKKKPLIIAGAIAAVVVVAVGAGFGAKALLGGSEEAPAPLTATLAASSAGTTCMVDSTKDLYCWGSNESGQLGDGTESERKSPAKVAALSDVTAVDLGDYQSDTTTRVTACAVSAGDAYCWGANLFGQVGDGTSDDRSTPAKVPGLGVVTGIATSWDSTCAISDGDVYCWGDNGLGQLGNGTTTANKVPAKVGGLGVVTSISTAAGSVCAVSDASLFCWGGNRSGEFGDGSTDSRTTPVRASSLTDVTYVSVGAGLTGDDTDPTRFANTCAIAGGEVYCMGDNSSGQLADGGTSPSDTPRKVNGIDGATSVAVDIASVCATAGGEVKCWGNNKFGQLGTGGTSNVASPAVVNGVTGVQQVIAGWSITCALAGDDRYCWGINSSNQLGRTDVTGESQTTPLEITLG